ncbi:MAG: hypothetical protein RRC34_10100 [Lentisphaeria bacterium]|nr:hypothetical protein [Lentisphaeria bacterium]
MILLYTILGFFALFAIASEIEQHRMRRIAVSRGPVNICAYARSFDYRNVDTRIMRAVFETVQEWIGEIDDRPFPVKADDDFYKTLNMCDEDMYDICLEVADDLDINMDSVEGNPFYGEVLTVKDLVLFLAHQPKNIQATKAC